MSLCPSQSDGRWLGGQKIDPMVAVREVVQDQGIST